MSLIEKTVLGKELCESKPKKLEYVFRNEKFGAVLFNKKNLKQIYVDFDCFDLIEEIDSKKTVLELLETVSKKSKTPKILLAGKFLLYLKNLKDLEFIELNTEIPEYKKLKAEKPPLVSAPNQISWLITNQCNLQCTHCGNSSRAKLENELSTKECKKLIDEFSENKVFVLNISGGEPFLREDLFELVKYARSKDIEVAITTNATMINEKNIEKIKEIDCFNIHLSLDGIGKLHDEFRNKKGLFMQVEKAVDLFREYKIPFGITTSITKRNHLKLDEVKEFILEKGITSWEIYYAIPVGCLSKGESLSDKEFLDLARKTESIMKELKGKVNVFAGDSLGYYGNCRVRDDDWIGCLAGINHCAIDAEGSVKGCPIQPQEMVEGNIRKDSLKNIWNDPDFALYNRKERKLTGECKKCSHSKLCRAGCITSMLAQGNKEMSENKLCVKRIESCVAR